MRRVSISALTLPLLLACGSKTEAPAAAPAAASPSSAKDPAAPATPAPASPAPAPAAPTAKAPTPAEPTPAAATCTHPGLVIGSAPARPIGSTRELAVALGKSAATDDEAVSALCQGRSPEVCNASMLAFTTREGDAQSGVALSVFVRSGKAGDGPWIGFQKLVPSDPSDESESIGPATAFDDGRLVHVAIGHSDRVFGSQCDPEGGCELDSETFGATVVDVVIDREGGRHAWTSVATLWGDAGCDEHVAPSRAEDAFVRSDCKGKTDRFSATELAACTPEVHKAWLAEQAKTYETEKAKAEKVLAERVQGGAVAAPKAGVKSATDHLAEGRRLTREKKFDEAIAAFTAASDADPELLEALSGRCYAKILRGKGNDLKDAIDDCDSVRTDIQGSRYEGNDRFFAAVCFNVGLAYEKLGEKTEALDAFELAHRRAPSEAVAKKIAALKGQ